MNITIKSIVRRSLSFQNITTAAAVRQVGDIALFRHVLQTSKNIVFLTGAGISEESGLTTFNSPGAVWRKYISLSLAHPRSFNVCPSLIWEFYNYRRELAIKAQPNMAHLAIAHFEKQYGGNRYITTITQNIDHLHARAGSLNLIELNGNLFLTRCLMCQRVEFNYNRPICPALQNTGSAEYNAPDANIPVECLPCCCVCGGLLRPHIVLFGESVDSHILHRADAVIKSCDLCVVISTPTLVYPALTYPPMVAGRRAVVAEFNKEPVPKTPKYNFYFEGLCSRTIPHALFW